MRPVDPEERIAALDVLRGFALYGVVLVNLVEDYLTQSLVCVALFCGIGFGLMNRVGSAAGAVIATIIFAVQA